MYLYLQLIDMESDGELFPLSVYKFGYKGISLMTDYTMTYDFGQEEDKSLTGLICGETFRIHEYPRN